MANTEIEDYRTEHGLCNLPIVPQRIFDSSVNPERVNVILATGSKWVNGTVLKYYFFQTTNNGWKGTVAQEQVVRDAFKVWKDIGMGLEFREVPTPEEADVRIGFLRGDGSWSYIGRDIWGISVTERTMNFGWNIAANAREIDTAIHEIGHTLGLHHEHQNPNAGIVWNEEAVYDSLAQPPNSWSRDKTFNNIIRKINPAEVQGSLWDPNSVMHYPFEAGLIQQPAQYRNGITPAGGLSNKDREYVKVFYPLLTGDTYTKINLLESKPITALSGEQQDFIFKPKYSKKYKIQTFGNLDTLLVLFEEATANNPEYLSGDDDSGTGNNTSIKIRLLKNRKYIISVRVLFRGGDGSGGIVIS